MSYTLSSWHPVGSRRNGLWQNAATVTLIGTLAGTGGNINAEHLFRHFGTGSSSRPAYELRTAESTRGLALELKSIRGALRLSVAETAQLFRVSRPTIYSWQNGNSIRPDSAKRLRDIANAITPHLSLLEAQIGRVAHRSIEGRVSLLQALSADSNVDQTISRLVEILNLEVAQRERLALRLKGRNSTRGSADLDELG